MLCTPLSSADKSSVLLKCVAYCVCYTKEFKIVSVMMQALGLLHYARCIQAGSGGEISIHFVLDERTA